jgi:Leucine-rich repeat (LRR) protein
LFVASLYLAVNDITGGISTEIGRLSNIQRLSLSKNSLGSSIPTEIGQLTRRLELHLSSTELVGTIPSQIGNCTRLGGEKLYRCQRAAVIVLFLVSNILCCTPDE